MLLIVRNVLDLAFPPKQERCGTWSRVRIPQECKFFWSLYIAVLLSKLKMLCHCHCVYIFEKNKCYTFFKRTVWHCFPHKMTIIFQHVPRPETVTRVSGLRGDVQMRNAWEDLEGVKRGHGWQCLVNALGKFTTSKNCFFFSRKVFLGVMLTQTLG
jgi:hypothetical protein